MRCWKNFAPRPQPADGVTFAPKVTVDDARVDWSAPALRVDRLVRACTPAPGAWTTVRGRRVKLGPVHVVEDVEAPLAPGAVRTSAGGVEVGTGSTPVRLDRVRPEGRGEMSAVEWVRGLRLHDDDRFV